MSRKGFKHHYLPQIYLKQFAPDARDSQSHGLIYARRRDWDDWKQLHPKRMGFVRGFYSVPAAQQRAGQLIERELAVIDGEYGRVARDVLAVGRPLSSEDQEILSYFLALMLFRTPKGREIANELPEQVIERLIWRSLQYGLSEDELAQVRNPQEREEVREFFRTMTREKAAEFMQDASINIITNLFHLQWISASLEVCGPMMLHKHWSILFDPKGRLMTSDNPTCLVPRQDFGPYGYSPIFPSVLVTLPLTRFHLLKCVGKRESEEVSYVTMNDLMVDYANYAQLQQWKEWLVSPRPVNLDHVSVATDSR